MKWKNVLVTVISAALLLQSCTLEKRRYMQGWHVDWHSRTTAVSDANAEMKPDEQVAGDLKDTLGIEPCSVSEPDALAEKEPVSEVSGATPAEVVTKKPDLSRNARSTRRLKIHEDLFQSKIAGVEETHSSAAGKVFGIIGFVLLLISIVFLLIGMLASLGWTSLGLIILATMIAALSFVFALISWLVFRHNGDTTPWFVWLTLIVGGVAVLLWLRVLLERA